VVLDSGPEPAPERLARRGASHAQRPTRYGTPTYDLTALEEQAYRPGDPPPILLRGPMPDEVPPAAQRTGRDRRSPGGRRRPAQGAPVHIGLPIPRIQRVLWLVTGTLVLANLVASVGSGTKVLPYTVARFFDGDDKVNFPTGAKTLLLLTCTVLLLACWTAARRAADSSAAGWLLLSMCTAFAFLDETTYLHQSLAEVLERQFHFTGPLKFAWTVVYWPMAAFASIFLMRNLRSMHPRVRRLLLPGGILYVIGAIVLEPVKSVLVERFGEGSLQMELAAAVSDSLQLIGLTLLVCSLLTAAGLLTPSFTLAFAGQRG